MLVLAISAAGCMTPPNPPPAGPSQIGSASAGGDANDALPYTPPSTVHPAPLKNAHVDQAQTQKLTDYLKAHHLPLVGGQVMINPSGQRQVILFGYVRTDYGKGDAESKARRYVNDSTVTVDNRIKIEPALANLNGKQSPEAQNGEAQGTDPNNVSGVEAYEQQRYEEQLQQQQIYGYQSQGGPSGLSMAVPFLGLFGGSFGGGGIGFGSGGFGGGYGGGMYRPMPPPSSYPPSGYPTYP
jgi:hypothetical protein